MRPKKTLPLLNKMLKVIVEYHDTTRNDSGLPYSFHPMEVSKDGSDRGIEEDWILAGYCGHDLLEDTKYTEDQMTSEFGGQVTRLVKECSKIGIDDEGIEKKMEFLKSFRHKSLEALLLKLSDRYCNVNDYKRGNRLWYPAYYALQAYPLTTHFLINRINIIDRFGEKVYNNYLSLVNELTDIVDKQYKIYMTSTHYDDENVNPYWLQRVNEILTQRLKK